MAEEKEHEVTLYVQSKKVITSFYRPPASRAAGAEAAGFGATPISSATSEDESPGAGEEVFFLSDDQARCQAMVEEVGARRAYRVQVIDVAKVGRLERLVTEHLRGVQNFPVLVGHGGQRLEGPEAFTDERLCEMMPAEMKNLRAFTYLKVKGGNLDRIRDAVLAFPEVRELHMLTGDWDVFIVLEFSSTTKRAVLDFVTAKIRGLADVLDTSTLVPEYSVSKFWV
jgi:AsnC-like helix-turn-helix protein